MLNKIESAIERFSLIERGDSITVALSGGADSTALLFALLELREKYQLDISAAHVNHMLRGDESDSDERFVREMCERLDVPLFVGRFDIRSMMQKGEGCEECARRVRYDFLTQTAKDKIATAHTSDDNMETVLFNLVRGSGIKGACGIPAIRNNIIRPLIMCSRADVENYCEKNGLCFVTDSSNLTDDYTRNKIRHGVIPLLREINPAVGDSFGRFAFALRDVDRFVSELAADGVEKAKREGGYDITVLSELHSALLPQSVKIIFESAGVREIDSLHINEVCRMVKNGNGKCQLSGGIFAEIKDKTLVISAEIKQPKNVVKPCSDFVNKRVTFGRYIIETELSEGLNVNNLLANGILDYDKIVGKAEIRCRKEGDSIKLKKRPNKSLKKLFCELKIEQEKRDELPVLADDKGVIWIYGIGCAERVAVDENSKKVLKISGVDNNE